MCRLDFHGAMYVFNTVAKWLAFSSNTALVIGAFHAQALTNQVWSVVSTASSFPDLFRLGQPTLFFSASHRMASLCSATYLFRSCTGLFPLIHELDDLNLLGER